ncbi:MAG: anthranilate synthase component I family protein [Flavobacteriales bacterium]
MEPNIFYLPKHRLGPILGIGVQREIKSENPDDLTNLQAFIDANGGHYLFGTLSYDLKNHFEPLDSLNEDQLSYPYFHFWVPEVMYKLGDQLTLIAGQETVESQKLATTFWNQLNNIEVKFEAKFKAKTTKETYFERFNAIKEALQQGDIYEMNYCQEFFAENTHIKHPVALFSKLNDLTKAPHAAYVETPDHFIFCASPERFLMKAGQTLRSEPIKGTAPRSLNPMVDKALAIKLQNDPKERSENIMIVDLVRNDLSQLAQKASVKVEELCEIYTFETVHQMISKISCQLKPTVSFTDILRCSFPMGSMTGAPKISAMQHIEDIEDFKRGLYSGSIGLIEPNGDFDFNVVIRSLIYNRKNKYLSCAVGSAITIEAEAEKEYQECLLKANKLIYGLQS